MTDCCEHKTSPYDIRPDDSVLIDAAIRLGEWLYSYQQTTQQQREAISLMLAFLRNLPAPPLAGLHGEFGFQFESEDETIDEGHYGSWKVCVCRSMFEMFGCGRDDLPELSWLLCPGHSNRNDMSHAAAWATQVANPMSLVQPGQRLVVEASTWSIQD